MLIANAYMHNLRYVMCATIGVGLVTIGRIRDFLALQCAGDMNKKLRVLIPSMHFSTSQRLYLTIAKCWFSTEDV